MGNFNVNEILSSYGIKYKFRTTTEELDPFLQNDFS